MAEFNPFSEYQRAPHLDQPRLVSGCNGFEDAAIPAQVGFIAPNGTEVQMSYERAKELGMVATSVIATVPIQEYAQTRI